MTAEAPTRARRARAPIIKEEQSEIFDIPKATLGYQESLRYLDHAAIKPDPNQPRKNADPELRESIKMNGLLQPLTVRRDPESLEGTAYILVDGERRWRSAEGILPQVPAIIRDDLEDELLRLRTQVVANTGKPLEALEEAYAYQRLLPTYDSVSALARAVGRAESSVRDRLSILDLGPWVELLASGRLPVSHLRVLLPLRTCPDEVHAHCLELVLKYYRVGEGDAKKGGAIVCSVSQFETAVREAYRRQMYPLVKSKNSDRPNFDTKNHDSECECGGIPFEYDYHGKRKCCGNPKWWRSKHRSALIESKKKARASGKASTSTGRPHVTYHIPEGVGTVTVKPHSGEPNGIVILTADSERRWAAQRADFDVPALAATLAPEDLVVVEGGYYGQRIGTKNMAAVKAAREAWETRWVERLAALREQLGKKMKEHAKAYEVRGGGVMELIAFLFRFDDVRTSDELNGFRDVAVALGFELPDNVIVKSGYNAGSMNGKALLAWLVKQDEKDAFAIAGGFAYCLATRTPFPLLKVNEEAHAARQKMQAAPMLWTKKASAESAEKPAKKAKKAKKKK